MKKILLAACAVLAMTGVARGEDVQKVGTVGNWEVFKGDAHCNVSADYQNGTSLIFFLTAEGDFSLRVWSEKWQIPSGSYSVGFQMDEAPTANLKFFANTSGNSIEAPIKLTEDVYSVIADGKFLKLKIGSEAYRYSLNGSAAALKAVIGCASELVKSGNPFSGTSQQPAEPKEDPSNPFRRT